MPPGWKSTAECGRQNSLKRWSAPCIWTPCICRAFSALVDKALADGEELLVILAHGGTQMAALERYALPHKDYYEWCGPNAGGFVLDAADWADKRVLHLVKTVQYTREANV